MRASPMTRLLSFTVAIGNICGELLDCVGHHMISAHYPMATTKMGQRSDVGGNTKNPRLWEMHSVCTLVLVVAADTRSKASCRLPWSPSSLKIIAKTSACWKIANIQRGASWGPGIHAATSQVVSRSLRCTEMGMCNFP